MTICNLLGGNDEKDGSFRSLELHGYSSGSNRLRRPFFILVDMVLYVQNDDYIVRVLRGDETQ